MSSMYRQAREEASKHASVRNMCFQQVAIPPWIGMLVNVPAGLLCMRLCYAHQ